MLNSCQLLIRSDLLTTGLESTASSYAQVPPQSAPHHVVEVQPETFQHGCPRLHLLIEITNDKQHKQLRLQSRTMQTLLIP
mmetsp:Transcript_39690/g.64406  ORF Transcript_39690/g.64406 Transcript_39690/m.64406 type:complete len:81 (+) Transcript_39690:146-388(+)